MNILSIDAFKNRGYLLRHDDEKLRIIVENALKTNPNETNQLIQWLTDEYGPYQKWNNDTAGILASGLAKITAKGTVLA